MNTLRLIRSNYTYADYSTNLSPALEQALEERISENAVVLNIFPQDSFTVGFLDDPEKCLDLEYCDRAGIAVRRRKNAGGAVFGAKDSAFLCFYLDTRLPWIPVRTIKNAFPFFLTLCSDLINEKFGIKSSYRPLNDIEIDGRKLVATSARLEQDILTLRCLINVSPTDRNVLSRAVIAHAEKFKDKKTKTVGARFTCLEEEAGRKIHEADLLDLTAGIVAQVFGSRVTLSPGAMTDRERAYAAEIHEQCFYANSERMRFREIPEGLRKAEGLHKAPAGLIRFTLLLEGNRIRDLIITGDFHPTPYRVLKDMEAALRGKDIDIHNIQNELARVYYRHDVEIAGTEFNDFMAAFNKAINNLP